MKKQNRLHLMYRLVLLQLCLTLLVAIISMIISGTHAALSALIGGLVAIIPDACFAWMIFRHSGARAARKIVNSFYKGAGLKFLLLIVLLSLVFLCWTIMPMPFFLAFFIAQLSYWFTPWLTANK